MGCSDGAVRIGSDLYIPDQDASCLHHSTTNTIVASGLNTGTVCIFDRESKSRIHCIPAHKYEIWYTCIVGDTVYSASDDCSFRGFDLRSAAPTLNNTKHHTAGVTFIKPWFEKQFITGSYDQTIAIWDERNFKTPVASQIIDGSVWDIKVSGGQVGISSIYEGYFFGEINSGIP